VSSAAVYLIAGLSLLVAVILPTALTRYAVSAPMVLVGLGMLIGRLPLPEGVNLDPVSNRSLVEHLSEITVLVALMGVGLALDRPLSLRDRGSWWRWIPTWRLLLIAMPLTIGALALLGWWALGLAPAAALLLGAALAPTDPVLASDVQVEGPAVETDDEIDERDEVRFALTSEAGLNDGLAFPFVHAAILLAGVGSVGLWALRWVAWELVAKVVIGVAAGVVVGRVLAAAAFRAPRRSLRLAELGEPLLAVAALLTAYGVSELVGGYGFLAVFTCALTVRAADRTHGYHQAMHGVVERLERLFTLFLLLLLGMAMTHGLLANLDWRSIVAAATLLLVIRPLAGAAALAVRSRHDRAVTPLTASERWVTSFFGVRGIGSIYYLAYAAGHASFADERWLWSTIAFTIAMSVFLHGVTVTPAMAWLERRRAKAASTGEKTF
jgi:NhaP-type Na+/H+ or K+/H+ antiporter